MASVSSLDQDMKQLRLGRYTPQAANEIRRWIEEALGERLAAGDLMEALRDGVALCKLINMAVSPGVKYKASSMPFVQMENISHFLKACEIPPLSLPAHDRFLTVDLYDNKDPAQVLQCIAAFSRRANIVNPSAFPKTVGAKSKATSMSPENTGSGQSPYSPKVSSYTTNTGQGETSPQTTFNSLNRAPYAERGGSPTKSNSLSRGGLATGGPVSSWSSRDDESKTAPAWNIHQYGYMGGASQGNQGVAFGARRQITSTAPEVPSLAEKEKRLREKIEREKQEVAENEQRVRAQQEADEYQAQQEELRRWEEETRKFKEEEDLARKQEEARMSREKQARNDLEAEQKAVESRNRQRTTSDLRLNGQFLSQYQASQKPQPPQPTRTIPQMAPQPSGEAERIAELERQLAEMKAQAAERERQEQQQQSYTEDAPVNPTNSTPSKPSLPSRPSNTVQTSHEDDWSASERDYLRKAHQDYQNIASENAPSRTPPAAPRPEPAEPARPLPDPTNYQPNTTRTSRFLSSNPAPAPPPTSTHVPVEAAHSTTAEVDAENARRLASQTKTKAGGWASKSLLEREMERERERQREWEENQKATATAARDLSQGAGPGQSWDVHQYGYTGGDNQNRGGTGLGVGGARRQIIGPRPPP